LVHLTPIFSWPYNSESKNRISNSNTAPHFILTMSVRSATMNIPLSGNSGNKNRKWPRLAVLATAAVLLSAISFIGLGGAIPQPQQAFGDANVTQSISQDSTQTNTLDQNQKANDNFDSTVTQSQTGTQSQSANQSASQVGTATD
jgi:hypothetical protein